MQAYYLLLKVSELCAHSDLHIFLFAVNELLTIVWLKLKIFNGFSLQRTGFHVNTQAGDKLNSIKMQTAQRTQSHL